MKHIVTKPFHGANQPATKAAVAELRRLFANRHPDLTWYYQVGEQVEILSPREAGRQYGEKIMPRLAEQIQPGVKSVPNILPQAREFFSLYSPKEVARLRRWRDHRRRPIGWARVAILVALKDSKVRKKVTEQCLKNRWTAARLREETRKHRTSKRRGGGFPPTVPKTTVDALKEIGRRCLPLLTWCDALNTASTGKQKSRGKVKLSPKAKDQLEVVIQEMTALCKVAAAVLKRSPQK